jgi:hypothetical protein
MELENEQEVETVENIAESEVDQLETESEQEAMSMEKLRELANKDVDDTEAESTSVNEESETPAYEPTLSYKFKDEERSFDERLLPAITNKETEEYVRELYTKSAGLDAYKEKYAKVEEEANSYYNQAAQLTNGFKALQEFRDSKNFDKLQQALGLSDDHVVEWALKRAEFESLPDDEKQQLKQQKEQETKLEQYQRQVESYEEMQHETQVTNDVNELKSLVNSESIRPVAEAMAQRGHNFVEQVLAMGQYEYKRTGVEPSIESVVRNIADKHAYLIEQAKQETEAIPQQQQQTQRKKALPSVSGTGQTRASKPKFTSLDALKKYADSL